MIDISVIPMLIGMIGAVFLVGLMFEIQGYIEDRRYRKKYGTTVGEWEEGVRKYGSSGR